MYLEGFANGEREGSDEQTLFNQKEIYKPRTKRVHNNTSSPRKKSRLLNLPHNENTNTPQDHINNLPDNCVVKIFSFLPSTRDRCSCAAVSKKWLILQTYMQSSEFNYIEMHSREAKNIEISRCLEGIKANDTSLAEVTSGIFPQGELTELSIRGSFPSQGITDFGLSITAQTSPSLKSLSLWDCTRITGKGIELIAKGCSSLEKLDLINLPLLDDSGLVTIAKHCPNLSNLTLESCPLIGNSSLVSFTRYSVKLERVSLVKCPLVGDMGIISIISGLPKLEKLKLVSMSIGDHVLHAIDCHGRNLSYLNLEDVFVVTQLGFSLLQVHNKLKLLSLKSCSGLNNMSFKGIGEGFIGLKQVSIQNCKTLTDRDLNVLTKSTTLLENLKLEECSNVTWNGLIEVFMNCGESLKALSLVRCQNITDDPSSCRPSTPIIKFPCLHSLTLKKCYGIGDSFLSWIAHACAQVKHLSLIGQKSITDRGIITLEETIRTEPKSLISVDLSGCTRITDQGIFSITSSFGERLKKLMLDGCEKVSDQSLKMIAELCPCLLDLDLSKCGIRDQGVFTLATCRRQHLEVLSLAGCMEITDRSLQYLEMMGGSLIGLNLKHTFGLTKEAIDSVRAILWWCDVLY